MSEPFVIMDLKAAIARQRFPFPNNEKPAWRTYINDGDSPIAALPTADGEVYPDILVIDRATATNKYIMAAAICLGEPSAEDLVEWRRMASATDAFYVFVQPGYCQRAAELAATGNLVITGFRAYSQTANAVEITDCF